MARRAVYTGFWWGKPKVGGYFEDPGLDGMIILRWILRNWAVVARSGSIELRTGIGVGKL